MSATMLIPDHELIQRIGCGSYGEVWQARNVMGQGRAVKIVRRDAFESVRPFEREFAAIRRYEPVSRQAEGLVNVLHVGRNDADGVFFYVMELADAASPAKDAVGYRPRTLAAELQTHGRLPPARCLEIALSLAQALGSLHRAGLVHRDIKPANIIFVNDRAKLADIGLVQEMGRSRSFVGTEGYIPPEGPGQPSADFYALGRVLYESLTGQEPHRFPMLPASDLTALASPMAQELMEVLLKSGEGDPARRYQNADTLLADLALIQSGRSVRHLHTVERRLTLARRALWALLAAVVPAAAAVFIWKDRAVQHERLTAAENLTAEQHLRLRAAEAAGLLRTGRAGDATSALAILRTLPGAGGKDRSLAELVATALSGPDLLENSRLPCSTGSAATVPAVVAPDGSWSARLARDSDAVILTIHQAGDATSGREFVLAAPGIQSGCLTASPGSRWLISASENDSRVWEVRPEARPSDAAPVSRTITGRLAPLPGDSRAIALSPDGREVVFYSLADGSGVRRITLGEGITVRHGLHPSPDGSMAAFVESAGAGLGIISLTNGGILRRFTPPSAAEGARWSDEAGSLTWTPDSRWIAAAEYFRGDADQPIRLMSVDTDRQATLSGGHRGRVIALAFSPDAQWLLSSSWDQSTRLWNVGRAAPALFMPGWGWGLGFTAHGWWRSVEIKAGEAFLSHGTLTEAAVSGHLVPTSHSDRPGWVAFVPGTHDILAESDTALWLFSGGATLPVSIPIPEGCAPVGGLATHRLPQGTGSEAVICGAGGVFSGHLPESSVPGEITWRRLSSDHASSAASGACISWVSTAQTNIFTVASTPFLTDISGPPVRSAPGDFSGVTVHPSRPLLAAWNYYTGGVAMIDALSGQVTHSLPVDRARAVFSAEGDRLFVTDGPRLSAWDVKNPVAPLWQTRLERGDLGPAPLAVSPDGRWIATLHNFDTPALFDARTGRLSLELLHRLGGRPGINCLTFSSDSRRLALTLRRGSVEVWNLDRLPPDRQ